MTYFITGQQQDIELEELQAEFDEAGVSLSTREALTSFQPDYSTELALAADNEALVSHLDQLLTYGRLSEANRTQILATLTDMADNDYDAVDRVHIAILVVMTSTDYLFQY